MSWLPQGSLPNPGFVQADGHGQSRTVPAVVAQRGRLWCLWTDLDGQIWYAATDDDGDFGQRMPFPASGMPVMANLNGHLHAVIVLETGDMMHYLYDDEKELAWACLGPLPLPANPLVRSSPCLVAFHNKLFLVYLRDDGVLYHVIWTMSSAHASSSSSSASDASGAWSDPVPVSPNGQHAFDGIPALFVIGGVLHLLCAADSDTHEILCFSYDYTNSLWTQCDDVSEGRAARGVSATSYGNDAYLGFIENGPGDHSHAVSIACFNNGHWQPHEALCGLRAADPPQIAILNGRIHCIFNDDTPTRDLRWYSRPILTYSLSSWMADVPGDTPLSGVTIPGTHDSCARSNIPFVRTQYLSITQQLALGIRFLDLRLRRRGDDNQLFCYHGGIRLDLPRGLSFASVMDEVWAFLRGPSGGGIPTETVLVSINNDDSSPAQLADPLPFYRAVADAIGAAPPWPDGTPRWFVGCVTPRLGEVRGRAVLLRRYLGDPGVAPAVRLGLDLSAWVDDSPQFTIVTPTGVRVHLQDKWKFAERISLQDLVATKSGFVTRLMADAARIRPPPPPAAALPGHDRDKESIDEDWYINFCSAVGDPVEHGEIAEAKWIAVGAHSDWYRRNWVNGMNRLTGEFLQLLQQQLSEEGEGEEGRQPRRRCRLGIVNLDYPELPEDNDLVARLIEMNF
ncbi:PLC-like phosphodiesterase [Bombardia bombarda]|uniref:PLC-like phosphodiesterase n=1 Tax=Bombardia bombarda TaxID=252184 RepID=A0AA40C170_9PEZI|nr:PLC-like phosphodiesterase [Bombardia bombarda]